MDLGIALDVAIGLVLMYLLLSLAVTAVVEYISQFFDVRARNLRATLERLLDGSSGVAQQGNSLFSLFVNTGQIGSMFQAVNKSKETRAPSYLDSKVFSKGLSEALALRDNAGKAAQGALQSIESLPDGAMKKVLLDEWRRAEGQVDKLEEAIAGWFDAAMERASGLFKRWTQIIGLVMGILVAIAFNADTFFVGKKLWEDKTLREQMTAIAQSVAADEKSGERKMAMSDIQAKLERLPIGWGHTDLPNDCIGWLVKAAGLVFTGMALAFGAPFWFDMLSKLVRLRSSGDKPQTAEEKKLAELKAK